MLLPSASSLRVAAMLGLIATSAAAQSLFGQYGEAVIGCGDPAPGLPGVNMDTSTSTFTTPRVDQNGTVVFGARLVGAVTTENNNAIFVGRSNGDLTLALQAGTNIPGLPPTTNVQVNGTSQNFCFSSTIQISPFGEIVFTSSRLWDPTTPANTPTTSDSALIWGPAGSMLLLAREGTQADDLPAGIEYGNLSMSQQTYSINQSGTVVFPNTIKNGGVTSADDTCVFTGQPGAISLVAREGFPASLTGDVTPPALALETWQNNGFTLVINENDVVCWQPELADSAQVTADSDQVFASYDPHALPNPSVHIWAREGDQAPTFAPTVTLFGTPSWSGTSWNKDQQMAFKWAIDDGGATIDATNDEVIWYGGPGGFFPTLREGDPTGFPVTSAAQNFGNFNNTSIKSNNGVIVFIAINLRDASGAALPAAEDSAMVYGTPGLPGSWTEVVREGQPIAIPPSANGPWISAGITSQPEISANGTLFWRQSCSDGVDLATFGLAYDPAHGIRVFSDDTESFTTSVGTGTVTGGLSTAGGGPSSDGGSALINNVGDVVVKQNLDGGLISGILRGHCGSLFATPASISNAAGGTQSWAIDVGPISGPRIWVALASESGTRPGFDIAPLGAFGIPLNYDAATQLSIDVLGQGGYANVGVSLDGTAAGGLTLPPGYGIADMHHAVIMFDFFLQAQEITEPAALRRR